MAINIVIHVYAYEHVMILKRQLNTFMLGQSHVIFFMYTCIEIYLCVIDIKSKHTL